METEPEPEQNQEVPVKNRFRSLQATKLDKQTLEELIHWAKTGEPPGRLKQVRDVKRWEARYPRERLRLYAGDDTRLFFDISEDTDEEEQLLELIPDERVDELLHSFYYHETTGVSLGRDRLYEKMRRQYANVSRSRVMQWLTRQESWQLHRQVSRIHVTQPIVTSAPRKHWQADLIDLHELEGYNNRHRYVLTVIDLFSKYAWARTFTKKTAENVASALEEILEEEAKKDGQGTPAVSDRKKAFRVVLMGACKGCRWYRFCFSSLPSSSGHRCSRRWLLDHRKSLPNRPALAHFPPGL